MNIIRMIVLKVLKLTALDIKINHHYTKYSFLLNSYNHKGYWYFGAKREEETVKQFKSWISKGSYVLEIGGHIGYFSTLYADIVGNTGKVDVFEPSEKNITYLSKNIEFLPKELRPIIKIINSGAGDIDGVLDFYIDPISGQNNSFVKDFEGFIENRKYSIDSSADVEKQSVTVIKLDTYFKDALTFPDFVKIDVEGFEWNVIQGFKDTITEKHPNLMIEIQADADKIIPFFLNNNYAVFNDSMQEITNILEYSILKSPNIFFRFKKNIL
jgi:FkbM family methyltransferase